MSNYPPGFGSAYDLDHVAGPLREYDLDETHGLRDADGFLKCDGQIVRAVWHGGNATDECATCGALVRELEHDDAD
jgi:hypothetical protein